MFCYDIVCACLTQEAFLGKAIDGLGVPTQRKVETLFSADVCLSTLPYLFLFDTQ
jgi:hypothetical protein